MSSPHLPSQTKAEKLKAEGNAFHVKGNYEAAYFKYSEAIEEDDENAILYANRSMSSLCMKEYLDAAFDAEKAVEIDPKYSKAWARLAKAKLALAAFESSIKAWETALSCLPTENLSAGDNALKEQFQAGLEDTKAALAKQFHSRPFIGIADSDVSMKALPWFKAEAMTKELSQAKNFTSSAWVTWAAYMDFKSGVEVMKQMKVHEEGSPIAYEGKTGALDGILNGILRDSRVFHMDTPEWPDLYSRQIIMEGNTLKGWDQGGAKTVKEEALKRLKTSGWTPIRRALSITVRAWTMRAFLAGSGKRGLYDTALEFYRSAIEVLEWGRREWKNVSPDQRGVIFDETFVIGIKRLMLGTMMDACASGESSKFTMEDVAEMAHDLIAETTACPPPTKTIDWGFHLSFWKYPIAQSLSALGWYHMQTARTLQAAGSPEANSRFQEAADYYIRAAEAYPRDDEYHPYFLKIALEAHWWRGSPLRVTLPLCKRIRLAIPNMEKIWNSSQLSQTRKESLGQALDFEVDAAKGILEGKLTLDDVADLEEMGIYVDCLPNSSEEEGK